MTSYHQQGYQVLSCTTDGFLVKVGEEREFDKETVEGGFYCDMFQTALSNLGIDKFFLEEKHYDSLGVLT
jgi:hypothetical protein